MKLLLTSAGIQNKSLADALINLVGKDVSEIKIGFIITAANVEHGNKDWIINQFILLRSFGFVWVDIIDIAAIGVDWQSRLAVVDVVMVNGGNTFYLLDQVRKTGFADWLKNTINEKVYVGISAGSIIVTPDIAVAGIDDGDKNSVEITDTAGLRFVEFEVSPHTPENVSEAANTIYANTISNTLYAFDNETGILVNNDLVEVISEGTWKKYDV
ncbi:MAG: hypothetical protein RLZZ70_385 [Candidatus Parcubacteria bacterium]|jgi:dipeptidase E